MDKALLPMLKLPPLWDPSCEWDLVTKEGISRRDFSGLSLLMVRPPVIEALSRRAFCDAAFFFRSSHLEDLADVAADADASGNDRFVAASLLKNAIISAQGLLPLCQDTGTASVTAWKGERVQSGGGDEAAISLGAAAAYKERFLRHSQLIPVSMCEERNSGSNLPAQIEIFSEGGDEYRFLFVAKGGGSSNKTMLFQETKSLLADPALENFLMEKLRALGVAGCPPYRLAIVIGGLSPEMTLKAVKLACSGCLDLLPDPGNPEEGGSAVCAFRDRSWEERVMRLAEKTGYGAQFRGKRFALSARVIRLPRHAASLPVGLGVGCNADRNVRGLISADGAFVERLDHDPGRFAALADSAGDGAGGAPVNLDAPMDQLRAELSRHSVGARLCLSGTLVVARDIAHSRMAEAIRKGGDAPGFMRRHAVYYAGPARTPPGMASGSFGPTTSARMDSYLPELMSKGASLVMLGKGNRSPGVTEACRRHGAFYLGTIGGAAALVAKENIVSVETLAFEELGMEAVRRIVVRNLPAFVICDDKGGCLYGGPQEG